MHYTKATEPERVGSPDTHLLILLGTKAGVGFRRGDANCGVESGTRHGQPVMESKPEQLVARAELGLERRCDTTQIQGRIATANGGSHSAAYWPGADREFRWRCD
jgi:hypothetical protein